MLLTFRCTGSRSHIELAFCSQSLGDAVLGCRMLQCIRRWLLWPLRVLVNRIAYPFAFQATEESLHAGVIPAVSFTAHAAGHSEEFECFLVVVGSVLNTAIRVVQQAGTRLPFPNRGVQGIAHKRCINAPRGGPADDATTVQIHHGGKIRPAFQGRDVGDVCYPFLVGRLASNARFKRLSATT